jgi:hypothetical protein
MTVKGTAAFLSQKDNVLPSQDWETVTRTDCFEPEQKLMLAVLEDAIWSYITYPSKRDPDFFEAENWFWQENSDWLFSFENICDVLNLSPQRIRQRLLRHKSQQPTERFQMVLSQRLKTMKRHRVIKSFIWTHKTKARPGNYPRIS